MPLPSPNASWPPASAHSQQLREHAAWYSGDPDALATFYAGTGAAVVNHPSQFRTGLQGRIARWWWGQPTPAGEQRSKLHVPLAADICGTSADLLFSEPVQLTAEDNPTLAEFLQGLQVNGLDAKLHEGGEIGAALGGTYLRTVWDSEVSPLPWTDLAHPDGALPSFRHGRLQSVTLWCDLPGISGSSEHYRLLEHHERGAIEYALYVGTATNLGKRKPLQDHPETEHLALLVNAEGLQLTGVDRLTVSYVPNMLPNRLHKNSPQGRSDLAGVTPILDALDEAYSSWWRDIRVAKARLHVPAQYLDSDGPGSAATVNMDREVYVPLQGVLGVGKDGLMIDAQQFTIRVEEHSRTCREWKEAAIESAGYSTNSLSSDGGGAMTATEVHAKNRRSFMTRGKKVRYWTAALQDHLRTQVEVANAHLRAGVTPGDFGVAFADGVQESAMALAQTLQALRNAEAASTEVRVRMLHPEWDDTEVGNEVARIRAEAGGGEQFADPSDAGL